MFVFLLTIILAFIVFVGFSALVLILYGLGVLSILAIKVFMAIGLTTLGIKIVLGFFN